MQTAPDTSDAPARGRPRCNEKNLAILKAAASLFLENGFDGTSMDEVARKAGVSKQTVYSHFSNKEALFGEALRARIQHFSPEAALREAGDHTLEGDLKVVATHFSRLLLNTESIALMRVLGASANKGDTLARIFTEVSAVEIMEPLAEFFAAWNGKGLNIDEPQQAVSHFLSLIKGEFQFRWIIGQIDGVSESDRARHIDTTVKAFIKLYGA